MSLTAQQFRARLSGGALLLSLCVLALPGHAVWQWMRGDALTDFNESDWAMLRATAREVLDDRPDHEQVNWTNPETGNRGSIIALATFSHDGRKCRRVAMRNLTFRGRDDKAAYSLCRQDDGEWMFVAESTLLAEGTTPPADSPAPDGSSEPEGSSVPEAGAEKVPL